MTIFMSIMLTDVIKMSPLAFLRCKTIAQWLLILIERKHTERTIVFFPFFIFIDFHYIILLRAAKAILTSSIFWMLLRTLVIVIVYLMTVMMYEGLMMYARKGKHTNIAFQNNPKRTCAYMVKKARGCP